MRNLVDDITKLGVLQPGETAQGAILLQPSGNLASSTAKATGGLVGVALGGLLGRKKQKEQTQEAQDGGAPADGGLAATVQTGLAQYLVATDQRWVVMSHSAMKGKPQAIAADIAQGTIRAIGLQKGKVMGKATVECSDGSVAHFELPRMNPIDEFVAAASAKGVDVTVS